MNTQPEALRLAKMIEHYNAGVMSQKICEDYLKAAAELRRLFELAHEQHSEIYGLRLKVLRLQAQNDKLMDALLWIAQRCPAYLVDHPLHGIHKEMAHDAGARARYAISQTEAA